MEGDIDGWPFLIGPNLLDTSQSADFSIIAAPRFLLDHDLASDLTRAAFGYATDTRHAVYLTVGDLHLVFQGLKRREEATNRPTRVYMGIVLAQPVQHFPFSMEHFDSIRQLLNGHYEAFQKADASRWKVIASERMTFRPDKAVRLTMQFSNEKSLLAPPERDALRGVLAKLGPRDALSTQWGARGDAPADRECREQRPSPGITPAPGSAPAQAQRNAVQELLEYFKSIFIAVDERRSVRRQGETPDAERYDRSLLTPLERELLDALVAASGKMSRDDLEITNRVRKAIDAAFRKMTKPPDAS